MYSLQSRMNRNQRGCSTVIRGHENVRCGMCRDNPPNDRIAMLGISCRGLEAATQEVVMGGDEHVFYASSNGDA